MFISRGQNKLVKTTNVVFDPESFVGITSGSENTWQTANWWQSEENITLITYRSKII